MCSVCSVALYLSILLQTFLPAFIESARNQLSQFFIERFGDFLEIYKDYQCSGLKIGFDMDG